MISAYFIRNPQMIWLLLTVIVVAGVSSLSVMPRLEDPILKQRVGVVTVKLAGASAAEIESTVTVPVEQWLREFSEIQQVRSNTRANSTNLVIELADEINEPDEIWSAIDRKLQTKFSELPDSCGEPELTVFPLKAFAAIFAIVPNGNQNSLTQLAPLASEFKFRAMNLEGTESVEIFGAPQLELVVEVKPEVLAATGLSTGSISSQIAKGKTVPAGNVVEQGMSLPIEVPESKDLQQRISSLSINLPGRPDSMRLSEIATISREIKQPVSEQAIVEQRDSIVLGIMVDNESRVDLWTESCQKLVENLVQEFPGHYEIQPLFIQSDELRKRMSNLLQNLLLSTLAVVSIVFMFMGWRCMLVVAVSLPISACMVICGLRWMQIPIHQMSVTGLIVALGLLIDNAIVMVEEVRSRVYQGHSPVEAIRHAVSHLGFPLLGSTLTTMLAFLPIAIMPGPSGEFVGALAVSVMLAVGSSLFLAVTVVPPLVFMLGLNAERTSFVDYGVRSKALDSIYRFSLKTTFRFPLLGVLFGAILPVLGLVLASDLPKQFFPATDRAQLQIEVERSSSSTIEALRETVDRVYSIVAQRPEVERQCWFLGKSAPAFYYNVVPRRRNSPSYAQAMIDVSDSLEIDQFVNQLQSDIDSEVFDARVVVRKLEQGPPFDAPVEIRLRGDDLSVLKELGDQARQILIAQPAVTHTRSDLAETIPKLKMQLDASVDPQTSLSNNELSKIIYSQLEGTIAGTFFDRGIPTPVRVKVDFDDRSVLETLLATTIALPAKPPAGSNANPPAPESFPLGTLGEFELGGDSGAIIRLNGKRLNEVKAYLKAGVLPSESVAQFKQDLIESGFQLPGHYEIEFGGEDEKRSGAVSKLVANATVIVTIMVVSLIALMGSFRFTMIVASVGGLAIGLGPLALYCFEFPLGFMAIVGTMGLIGIAINDSIVVLAAIRESREQRNELEGVVEPQSESRTDRLAEVVVGCTRHILATTLTTMVGFLPLVIDGGRFWPPLAIVISAGVGGATLLALYFVPSAYMLLHRE